MYLFIKTSKRRVKYHDKCYGNQLVFIPAGQPYIQISNGTIGTGSRYRNYPLEVVSEMILRARTANINCPKDLIEQKKEHINSDSLYGDIDIPF